MPQYVDASPDPLVGLPLEDDGRHTDGCHY